MWNNSRITYRNIIIKGAVMSEDTKTTEENEDLSCTPREFIKNYVISHGTNSKFLAEKLQLNDKNKEAKTEYSSRQ